MPNGEYMPRNIKAAAWDGRIALIAVQGGDHADIDLRALMVKRLKIAGATLRAQSVERKGRLAAALRQNIWPLFSSRALRGPPIHARFPLREAGSAHTVMEGGEHIGKLVLVTGGAGS